MPAAAGSVVVPLDGSQNSEYAIPAALQLARQDGAPLAFVHVPPEEGGSLDEAGFGAYAAKLLESIGERDVAHSATLAAGNPAQAVLDFAAGARAIVLASHGRGGLKAAFIGSVADKIVRNADIPVLVVPVGGVAKPGSAAVVVGLDGSEMAERALPAAREFAKASGAEVILVRAFSIPPPAGMEFAAYPVDVLTPLEESCKEYLNGVARAGEKVLAVMSGSAEALQQAAEQSDAGLIVVASHGKGFVSRLALGSTTDRLMHNSDRPLLVVPASAST
jgi:nucleotide-binding universal stress UspA family protein